MGIVSPSNDTKRLSISYLNTNQSISYLNTNQKIENNKLENV